MDLFKIRQKIKRRIRHELVLPLCAPYLSPEQEERWGKVSGGILSSAFAPLRKWRDRRLFHHHLRQTDIFLVGHPKSGNTWLAYMLAVVLYRDFSHHVNLATIGNYVPVIHARDSKIAAYTNLSTPRVFRNEWPMYPDLYPKIIYLIRDPRSVLVSYYHMYHTIFNDLEMTMSAFINEYLSYGCIKRWEPLKRWDKQVIKWIERADNDKRVLIVKYEDMVQNRSSVLRKIVDFAELSCSDDLFALAEARGSFESMRDDESKHGAESYISMKKGGRKSRFIRSGRINGWKKSLDHQVVERIENELGPAMRRVGYLA